MAVDNKELVQIILDIVDRSTKDIEKVTKTVDQLSKSLEKLTSSTKKNEDSQTKLANTSKKTSNSLKSAGANANAMVNTLTKGSGSIARFSNAVKNLGKSVSSTDSEFKSFKLTITGMEKFFLQQGLAIAAVSKAISFLKNSMKDTETFQNALTGLAAQARYAGEDVGKSMKEAEKLTKDGLLGISDAATSLRNLLSRGFTLEESIKIINRLKDAAAFGRQSSLTLSEAVRSATEGLKNEMSVLVDNAGVTKNVSLMWKDYAKSIGKGVESLTLAEKRHAEFLGIMQETEGMVGNAARAVNNLTGANARLSKSYLDLKVNTGTLLTPAYTKILELLEALIFRTRVLEWAFEHTVAKAIYVGMVFKTVFNPKNLFIPVKEWNKKFEILSDVLDDQAEKINKKYLDNNLLDPDILLGPKTMMDNVRAVFKDLDKAFEENLSRLETDYKDGVYSLKEYYKLKKEVVDKYYIEEIDIIKRAITMEKNLEAKKRLETLLGDKERKYADELKNIIKEQNKEYNKLSLVLLRLKKQFADIEKNASNQTKKLIDLYNKGQITTTNFFEKKRTIVNAQYNEEIKLLKETLSVQSRYIDKENIRAKISIKEKERADALNKINKEEYRTLQKIEKIKEKINNITAEADVRAYSSMTGTGETDFQKQQRAEIAAMEDLHRKELQKMNEIIVAKELQAQKEIEIRKLVFAQQTEMDELLLRQQKERLQKKVELEAMAASTISGTFSDLNTAFGEHTKAFFLLEKAAAIAEVIINTQLGVMKAIGQMGPFGISMGALIRAQGAAAIAAISAQTVQGLATGGEVKGYSPNKRADNIPINATAGEFMQPVDTVKYYGKDFMEAIRRRMIPKDVFSKISIPSYIMKPSHNFNTGGLVTATNNNSVSVSVPVSVNGLSSPKNLSMSLKNGIEDVVMGILRREFR